MAGVDTANICTRDRNKGCRAGGDGGKSVRRKTMWVIGDEITNTEHVCEPVNNAAFARRVISNGKHLNCSAVD